MHYQVVCYQVQVNILGLLVLIFNLVSCRIKGQLSVCYAQKVNSHIFSDKSCLIKVLGHMSDEVLYLKFEEMLVHN